MKSSPEANAIRKPMKVINSSHEKHAFLMETMCLDGICMLFEVVLGCSGRLPVPDHPLPSCLSAGSGLWVAGTVRTQIAFLCSALQ